ncbi:MAG: oligosaccharide flippase family protein [Candidatus Sungbacteria bacterium]|nr:oligosaccharide flippase family protein [Candidatus Sungbacteria bacterium]
MKQSRLTGAISLSIAQAIVLLLGYVTHLWIGRVLGPAPYGIYGIVLSVQTILGLFITLGVPAAVSRFIAQHEEHSQAILSQTLKVQAAIASVIALLTILLAPLLSYILGDKSLMPYLAFVAPIIFCQALYPIYTQFLSGMHRFHKQAALTAIYAVAKLAGAIGFIYVFHLYGALFGFALGGIVAGIVGWAWTRSIGKQTVFRVATKDLLEFAGLYVLVLAGLQVLMSLDLLMVKALLKNDVVTGYYNAASTLARIPYFLLQGLSFILLPSVSALTKTGGDQAKAANFIRDTLRYLVALIIPSVALAATTSQELVALFFSREFLPSAQALTILMVGLGTLAFYLLLANIAAGAGKAKFTLSITAGMLLVSALIGSLTIPRFGLIGAAWQTTISAIFGFVILAAYTFRTFKIPPPVRSTVNVIIATAIAIAPTYVWKASGLVLPVQYFILYGMYIAVLAVLGEITDADRSRFAGIHPALKWFSPSHL